ncbi:H(+)/Cl(-) exchange transporter ClcA [Gordonia cholesterolivorans]|uniref:H(+)/Cl(-) exchange transporter ClcA n=2 Tax=Gordonia cholesterolivorans TaxID=559625 RepID=A0ABN3HT15_9ACTN
MVAPAAVRRDRERPDDDTVMCVDRDPASKTEDSDFPGTRVLVLLTCVALVAGALTGLVGGAFRWTLSWAEERRADLVDWSGDHGLGGALIVIAVAAASAAAAVAIVRRIPLAAGSGIQQVEAVEDDEAPAAPWSVIPARFAGGVLSMGFAGMVLGREGPTVHMGAAIGAAAARLIRATSDEIRVMQTATAGAGLAVAFNAPIGGALFAFEEVAKKIRLRYAVWTLTAVAAAVACSRLILGDAPDFRAGGIDNPSPDRLWVFLVFGVLVGALGVVYSRLLLLFVDLAARIRVPAVVLGALVGAGIGILAITVPSAVGGGDDLAQRLLDAQRTAFWMILAIIAMRFVTGPVSYGTGAPGGLFAPMLALGALTGAGFGRILEALYAPFGDLTPALVVVGMSTLFAAVVRVPLTAIVLVMEMTAVTALTVPMAVAVTAGVATASLAGSKPVYDALRERYLRDIGVSGVAVRPHD